MDRIFDLDPLLLELVGHLAECVLGLADRHASLILAQRNRPMLVAMKCEVAQGFIIGRPSSLNDLSKRLGSERKRRAA